MTVDLRGKDRKVFSQNGEDGIIETIFATIGTTNRYYVEFGTQDGTECNTRLLREQGWDGLLMDGGYERPEINLHKHFVTAENVHVLFDEYAVPDKFDLLSIDVDCNDFWIWGALLSPALYRPRVVVIEWNCSISPFRSLVVPYDKDAVWDGSSYYGASIKALQRLGNRFGYGLVGAEKRSTNLFFVRYDAGAVQFEGLDDISVLHPDWVWSHPQDEKKRPFINYE